MMKRYLLLFATGFLLAIYGCRLGNANLNKTAKHLYEADSFRCYCDTARELLVSERKGLIFPAVVLSCKHLTSLNLQMNNFAYLPTGIVALKDLEDLSITNSRFKRLPATIGELKHLKSLCLLDNNISSLPNEIGKLDSLVELNLNGNPITELTDGIYQLKNLRKLYVGQWDGSVKIRQTQLDSLKLLLPDCVVRY